jgi:hypothetical protein
MLRLKRAGGNMIDATGALLIRDSLSSTAEIAPVGELIFALLLYVGYAVATNPFAAAVPCSATHHVISICSHSRVRCGGRGCSRLRNQRKSGAA